MIDHSRKFVTVCGAAVLALGLAACSSSGGRQMSGGGTTPELTELDKARMAAMAAKDAARMKSDEADAEADKADEALMGIAVLQTAASTATMDAEAARVAADAAMAAYEKANAEYEKAKAAGDVTAAVTAQVAAEKAKAQAEAQAAMAREKAAAAATAAMKDVKVASDGKTFSVGGLSITAGAPKRTATRDGVNRVTGKVNDLFNLRFWTERSALDYAAGPPERRAQPAVAQRSGIVMGSMTDSDDDTVRLFLVDKYGHSRTDKTVGIFRDLGGVDPTATASGENPYGTVDVSGTPAPIMRAEGEFYMVSGNAALTKRNANGATIVANTNDANAATGLGGGIYYYMANNTKRWLRLNRSATDTSGVVTLTYDNISVYENVRFPDAKPYEHINFGQWVLLKEDGGPRVGTRTGGDTYPDLGIAFVSALPGQAVTPAASMRAAVGTATYQGQAVFHMRKRANHASGPGEIRAWRVHTTTTANFSNNTIAVNLDVAGTLSGMIDGNGFSGTRITNITNTDVTQSVDGSIYTASFSGNFFGPEAREVGGVFDVTSEDMKHGAWRGAFGGRSD